jgi:pyruvate kinase
VIPILIQEEVETFEEAVNQAEQVLLGEGLVESGDRILILGGIPMKISKGTNFLKIHNIK